MNNFSFKDKEPLFDAVETISKILPAMEGMIKTANFRVDRMLEQSLSPYIAATDLAEWLVKRGLPFREAHATIGKLVERSISEGKDLQSLVLEHQGLGEEAVAIMKKENIFTSKITHGSASLDKVGDQLLRFSKQISEDEKRL